MEEKPGSHGRQMKYPWLRAHPIKGEREENPQLDGIMQTQTVRVTGANKLADSAGTGDSWPETMQGAEGGWERDSPGHWVLGTVLCLCNMLTHSSIQQPCWKGPCPHFTSVTTAVGIRLFLFHPLFPQIAQGHLLLSWLKEIWNGAQPEGV